MIIKKFILILFSIIFLFSFSACSEQGADSPSSDDEAVTTTETTSETTSETTTTTTTSTTVSDGLKALSSPISLLNYYVDDEGHYRINEDNITFLDDYDLFREYFFGIWEGEYCYTEGMMDTLIIDDSEQSNIASDYNCWYSGYFFQVSDHVLAFITGSDGGGSIHWIDTNDPDTLYITKGSLDEYDWIESLDKCYTLTKTDEPVNEPENGYLSIFKLYEMYRDYGIDLEMLTDIEYERDGITLKHDSRGYFFPTYLISEEAEKLVLKAVVNDLYSPTDETVYVEYTIEKVDGEWFRTVRYDEALSTE